LQIRQIAPGVLILMSLISTPCESNAQATSKLWGTQGEHWSAESRLPDHSRAGYHSGDRDIPDVAVVADVKDFGAVGDGKTDDSVAFQTAIDQTEQGAILIPPGRYVLTAQLQIRKPNLVLRGSGRDQTILYIPKSLLEVQPREGFVAQGVAKHHYSFGSAFVQIRGDDGLERISGLERPSSRGSSILVCETAGDLAAGEWIQLRQRLDEDLGRHLHAGQNAGKDTLSRTRQIEWVARVVSVGGKELQLDRPLRIDARPEWKAVVHRYRPTVQEVGIEGLTFEFAGKPKKKHLLEEGFNAIQITNVMNCWVRNVRFIDADMGVKIGKTRHFQGEDFEFAEKKRTGRTGHHAIWVVSNSQDCLFQRFRIETTYVHDLSVEGFAQGIVFSDGSGRSINLDHHRSGPFENLFTNLDVGDPKRLWRSSGRGDRGPHSAARTTAWNIRHSGGDVDEPNRIRRMFPLINIIGIEGYAEKTDDLLGPWIEPNAKAPPDLYQAQVKRRKASEKR